MHDESNNEQVEHWCRSDMISRKMHRCWRRRWPSVLTYTTLRLTLGSRLYPIWKDSLVFFLVVCIVYIFFLSLSLEKIYHLCLLFVIILLLCITSFRKWFHLGVCLSYFLKFESRRESFKKRRWHSLKGDARKRSI